MKVCDLYWHLLNVTVLCITVTFLVVHCNLMPIFSALVIRFLSGQTYMVRGILFYKRILYCFIFVDGFLEPTLFLKAKVDNKRQS